MICTDCYDSGVWFDSLCCEDDSSEYVVNKQSMITGTLQTLSGGINTACCNQNTDCVHNGECYNSGTATVDIDGNGDLDYCDNGIWKDCGSNPNDECSGAYPQCSSNMCASDCYGEPCLAGQSTCLDYEEGLLYCVNGTDDNFRSSFVENPIGDGTEGYCYTDEYYKTGFFNYCVGKTTSPLCYDFVQAGNVYTLSLSHTASTEYCNIDGSYYLTTALPSTDEPLESKSAGPDESIIVDHICIETDGGDNVKQWGCVFNLTSATHNGQEFYFGGKVCDVHEGSNVIEFYCSGNEIKSRTISCDNDKLLGLSSSPFESDKPYCFNSGITISTQNVVSDYIKNVGIKPPSD